MQGSPVESGAGAPASGSGGCSVAFAPGLSPAPMAAFPGPRSPNPACRFPAPGSPAGSCASHTDHRDEVGAGPITRHTVAAARRPSCLPHRRRCAAEPVHAPTTSNRAGSTPSLLHVMRSELSALRRGYRQSHSRRLSSFPHPSAPEAPSLRRHYPASAVLRASPPPCRPGLPLAGFRLARARHRQGFPCCHHPPLPRVPPSLPRRSQPVRVARFPAGGSLPRYSGGSASAMPVSRPARRSLCALRPTWSLSRPRRPVPSRCFSRSRYLLQPLRLLPAGATVAGRGSHPLGDGAFPRRTE